MNSGTPVVGVAAISGETDREKLEGGINVLEDLDCSVKLASNIYSSKDTRAGTDSQRAAGLNELIRDDLVDVIMFARGGSGADRILKFIDYETLKKRSGIIIGYSDLTYFQNAALVRSDSRVFYGPVVQELPELQNQVREELNSALLGYLPSPVEINSENILQKGRATGVSHGGCLTLLSSLYGTPYHFTPENGVLIWEDVNEPPYRIDRYLTHMKNTDTFHSLRAMMVAKCKNCEPEEEGSPDLRRVVQQHLETADFPCLINMSFGHREWKYIIPLGVKTTVDTDEGVMFFDDRR